MLKIKKILIGIAIFLAIGIVITVYLYITAKPEPQTPITTPSQFETDEVSVNPEKY